MICIPIRKKTFPALLKHFKAAQKEADIVEVWFDEIELTEEKLNKLIAQKTKPILYKVTKQANPELFKHIDYIDVDLKEKLPNPLPKRIKKIISHHDFKKTPTDTELKKIVTSAAKKGADIIKIAATAKTLEDSMRMLSFLSEQSKKNKCIFLCMGKEGIITRTTGHLLGNYLMYAPLNEREKTAPGQLTVKELKKLICL